jgi:hypothetical protein
MKYLVIIGVILVVVLILRAARSRKPPRNGDGGND